MLEGLNIFVGGMGAGKSYGMTRQIYEAWQKGCMVLSPMKLKPPKKYAHLYRKISAFEIWGIMETEYEKDTVLALDEGWIVFNSYVKTKLPLDVQIDIMSCRKNRLHVYLTAQR